MNTVAKWSTRASKSNPKTLQNRSPRPSGIYLSDVTTYTIDQTLYIY